MDYQHAKTKVFLVNYHIIFCPKRRKKVLVGELRERLIALFDQVACEHEWRILVIEVMPDHVHLFVSVDPDISPNSVVRVFKGRSSRILREEFPALLALPSLWTRSYFISTAGNVSSAAIQKYIENQTKK